MPKMAYNEPMRAWRRLMRLTVPLMLLWGCEDGRAVNSPCETNTDCASEICHSGICAAKEPRANGQPCVGDGDCRSFKCVRKVCVRGEKKGGSGCLYGEQCASRMCDPIARKCAPYVVQSETWAVGMGGGQQDAGRDIVLDGNGNVYVVGWYQKQVTFGSTTLTAGGNKDIFVAKLDKTGKHLWAKGIEANLGNEYVGLAISAAKNGDVYITGHFNATWKMGSNALTSTGKSDIFVARLDKNSAYVWADYGGGEKNDGGRDLVLDSSGDLYVTGYFHGTLSVGTHTLTSKGAPKSEVDLFVGKVGPQVDVLWATNAGGTSETISSGIAVDSKGNSFITGHFGTNGEPATIGTSVLTSYGGEDIFVAKLGKAGKFLWAKNAGGAGHDRGLAVALDSAGDLYVAGLFEGTATVGKTKLKSSGGGDVFVAAFDEGGGFRWATSLGGTGNDEVNGLALDAKGNIHVVGAFYGAASCGSTQLSSAGGADIYVARLSKSGTFLEAQRYGGKGDDFGGGITLDGAGNIYVTGSFRQTMTLGTTVLTSRGDHDIFVARIK